jgi:DNA transposition AAA+ family ATPase
MDGIVEINAGAVAPDAEARAQELRTAILAELERDGLSVRDAAPQMEMGYSTLNAYLADKYQGNVANLNDKATKWLETRRRGRTLRARRRAPDYLETPTAQAFEDVFAHAQGTPDVAMVTGGAGVGKTLAAAEYQRRSNNVWIMTADSSMRSPTAILRELAEIVESNERRGPRILNSIVRRVDGTAGLIIVDEAQNLQTESIDLLRTIHDRGGIGIVFMGNEPLRSRIEGMGRQASHAQIFSRIGMRRKRDKPQVKDVMMILDGWGVAGKPLRDLCRYIAMQPGGLRAMNKTLAYAHTLAAAHERDTVGADDVNRAWSQLTTGVLPSFEAE